jgi:hypothetical protein
MGAARIAANARNPIGCRAALVLVLITGCGGKSGSGSGDASADAACAVSNAPHCAATGAPFSGDPPCNWDAAVNEARQYCGVTWSGNTLMQCGAYYAFNWFNVDVGDYFFYDATGKLVGDVRNLNGYVTCSSYDPAFVPPPHDPVNGTVPGCVNLSCPDAGLQPQR